MPPLLSGIVLPASVCRTHHWNPGDDGCLCFYLVGVIGFIYFACGLQSGYLLYDRVIRPAEVGVTEALDNGTDQNTSKWVVTAPCKILPGMPESVGATLLLYIV